MTDPKDINNVIKTYDKKIDNVIKKFFRSNDDIEDIKQEVLIKTWKNLLKQRKEGSFWGWIYTITSNTCKDQLKSRKKILDNIDDKEEEVFQNLPDLKPCPEKKSLSLEKKKTIYNAIEKLNPKFKEVIIMHDIDELTYEEIALKVKCPVGTVKSRLFNARKVLREELSGLLV